MVKKIWMLGALLGVSLLFAGCVSQPSEPVEVTKYVCADGTTIVTELSLCPAATPVPTRAPLSTEEQLSVCTGMPETQGASLEDVCIEGVAAKNKDALLCQEVSATTRPTCYALVAEAKSNVDVCAEAGSYKDPCFELYARNVQDATACGKITDVSRKNGCYSNLASTLGDPSLCDKILNVGQKDDCYFNAAMRLGDTSYCNKITSADRKQNCLQNIGGGSQVPKMG